MDRTSLLVLLLVSCGVSSATDAIGAERIIVSNSRLVGRETAAQDVTVNLLIVDGKLVVVTKDALVIQPGDVAVDASGGFIFGQLALGTRPSFMVVDQDPRENFDVLLDTGAHARFAIRDGVIVKNELPAMPASSGEGAVKPRRWKAHTPPPIAVPIRYYDSRKWNKFETKPISGLFVGALLLDRLEWLSQDADSESQVGDVSGTEGSVIRAARLGVVGTLNFKRPWRYTVMAMTHTFDKGFEVDEDEKFSFSDYRLDIPLPGNLNLGVGKQKEPISMDRLMGLAYLPMQERAAFIDALLPSRNHGVTLSGVAASENVSWSVGAFNNWIDSGVSFSDTADVFAGRTTWAPAAFQSDGNLIHVGLGLRYSDLKQNVRVKRTPELNQAPVYIDSGEGGFSADDQISYSLEAYWRNGPYWLGFEYLGTDVNSPQTGNPFFSNYNVTGSWAITGETRAYRKRSATFDPLPVARPVNQGGWGAVELAARYSKTDVTDGVVQGGDMDVLSVGCNWWLTRWAQLGANYRYIFLDRVGVQGESSGLNVRLLLMMD